MFYTYLEYIKKEVNTDIHKNIHTSHYKIQNHV